MMPNTVIVVCVLVMLFAWYWYRQEDVPQFFGGEEAVDGGGGDMEARRYALGGAGLVGAAKRPDIHPRNTQTIHQSDASEVMNSTMDAVNKVRGTGLFKGIEMKPRSRLSVNNMSPESILAATSRPRGVPTPGVYKKNSNRQIRPDPTVKEGVDTLPAVSTLKNISSREQVFENESLNI